MLHLVNLLDLGHPHVKFSVLFNIVRILQESVLVSSPQILCMVVKAEELQEECACITY